MRKILEKCPTCEQAALIVNEMQCTACATVVRSHYQPTIFSQLDPENLRFVEIFVRNKGNVKEMERELGVSYWAIRNRLNDLIEQLWPDAASEPSLAKADRDAILRQLEAGELSVQEAAEQLKM